MAIVSALFQYSAPTVALAWKLNQLRRAPHDRSLLVVAALLVAALLSLISSAPATSRTLDTAFGPGTAQLTNNVLLFLVYYLLLAFFLYADCAYTRLRFEAGVFVVASAALAASTFAAPSAERVGGFSSTLTATVPPGPFYLIGELYLGYMSVVTIRAAWRYTTKTDARCAWGLRIMVASLVMICVCGPLVRTSVIVLNSVGEPLPTTVLSVADTVVGGSIILFLLGITYAAALARAAIFARWRRHRSAYHRMYPLWVLLQRTFPQILLLRGPRSAARDRFSLTHVHLRYYRRAIECRDGLVLISPWLAGGEFLTADQLAPQLRRALCAYQSTPAPSSSPCVLARPSNPALDSDVEQLIALAAALRDYDRSPAAYADVAIRSK